MMNIKPHDQAGLYSPEFEHDSCGVGFVCSIKGDRSNKIVKNGIEVLYRLAHRGATGSDPLTGDGAGILIQMPHDFFAEAFAKMGVTLPASGSYGSGLVFFPSKKEGFEICKKIFEETVKEEGQKLLGFRDVPVDDSVIGKTARDTQPKILQPLIERSDGIKDAAEFERKLYVIRKRIENKARGTKHQLYITNLSCKTFSYKGLLMPEQVDKYFLDLKHDNIKSAICLVHSRYSTNTFPTWDLAQPFKFLAHNGEINTIRGNINWMRAKENLLNCGYFGEKIEELKPVVSPGGSDSAALDNVFEFLVLSGRSLAHSMMMLIPPAWENNEQLTEEVKDFYKYQSCLMEPWDGPAAVAFTDGTQVGAVLDRNGLRPARYIITKDDLVVMSSEAGVLDIEPSSIKVSGRIEPGKMFFIDTREGRIIDDEELKKSIIFQKPYSSWIKDNMVELNTLPRASVMEMDEAEAFKLMQAYGYTREDLKAIIKPMAQEGQEPVGSMGNDTPHAVLSKKPQLLYSYFKQLFAQVTNPPIDPIREDIIMSLISYMGPRKNILEETPGHCRKLRVHNPILTDEDVVKIKSITQKGFKTKTISMLFDPSNPENLKKALSDISSQAEQAIKDGFTFLILSDRGVNKTSAAIPALLALGTVHQYLVKKTVRSQVAIIVESGEPREVHHFALLFAYGAGAVNPYLAYSAIDRLSGQKEIDIDYETGVENYNKAVYKGIKKILSKMGISTLQSYRGAQIFEAIGLGKEVIDTAFCGSFSRIGGADLNVIASEAIERHRQAFGPITQGILETGGLYQWKKDGEFHLWNPESIAALQDSARNNNPEAYKEFSKRINDQADNPATLRGLMKFKQSTPVPLEEVEPVEKILNRFVTGAMSFGSISKQAHETIAIAMNRIGAKSNTGEGGEDPVRFVPLGNGDSKRSAIKQVASGRFGVTTNYLINADEIQIKIAQGAKPGEGGQLPGHKVSATIARIRYTTAGVTLISPPPHHDIYSIEDLSQLIFDLKNTNPRARISVKLVSEMGVGTVAAGVAKGHADMILISGGDGGTGASPLSSIKHAGIPWELGLSETHQTLVLNDLRSRVRLQTDGQMRTGRDVAIAALLGAEEYGFCTAILITLGCVMLRHCHLNNCSLGVATQDELLEKRFSGKSEYIINYLTFVAQEFREIMAQLGFRKVDEMIGRVDLLEMNSAILPWKAKQLDLSKILYKPQAGASVGVYCTKKQQHAIENVLDKKLIELSAGALKDQKPVIIELPIKNINRTAGAMLSGEVCRLYGEGGLADDTIHCKFKGVSGQSFGAFLMKGITFELEGMANDYTGKGMSGGKIVIYPDRSCGYEAEKNIVMGNTSFYGAVAGEAYIRGVAGERFCIRNSGITAVVEGVGDHACEYMTGGSVLVLGKTGRNFAAGMSGGIAYVYNEDGSFNNKCNMSMIIYDRLDKNDETVIHDMLKNHIKYTGSALARSIFEDLKGNLTKFIKVMPKEYKNIIESKKVEEVELDTVDDGF